jgi:Zinc carboxypeptidase/Chitobiase/beta-hexosaminidase C-terminal domain
MTSSRRWLVAVSVVALAGAGGASATRADEREIDPNQGQSLVEVNLPNKAAAMRLQVEADTYGVEFNDEYLRRNRDGSVTVTVLGDQQGLDRLDAAGYELARTISGPNTLERRAEQREAGVRKEERADAAALDEPITITSHEGEIVILRADYFENYTGRYLSVEAKTRLAAVDPATGAYTGPTLSLSWNKGTGTEIDSVPRVMSLNIDPDTTPDTYIEHRQLVRIGDVGTSDPAAPTRIRIGSSTGQTMEGAVSTWLGGGLPPIADGFLKDFTTHYMDPTEVYGRFRELAAEFPNIAKLITLPNKTNGYQRKAQANMSGTLPIGNAPSGATAQGQTVVLTSRAWGHEGGNDITAEFVNPGVANAPLTVTMTGNDLLVSLGTDAAGAASSTAAQVVEAINANTAARPRVFAASYRGNVGAGIVEPHAKVNLSDFLDPSVAHGPFEYSVMRIGKRRDGSRVGVFLYCEQHAREWATPLTCLETAERLLRNYAIDKATRNFVDNLDIFILPVSNPDGSHYAFHNFNNQRRNMTNHCAFGWKETDDPNAANFGLPRQNPGTGALYTNTDPASRNAWGVDLNRNNTFGTLFDGYIGASYSCTSDVFAGPAEASEPEIRNELWIADTFKNIKFSNNIHSFGGYFMWAPGAYLPDRGEGDEVHANIGIEKYFFEAGDKILNRIKEQRNTVILPERTGPIADVLYSAAGNSADEHWYNRGTIAYSFETGADLFFNTTLSVASEAGATGIRAGNRTCFAPGDTIKVGAGTADEEARTVATIVNPNPASPAANITLTQPLSQAHTAGAVLGGGICQTGVGFQPDYATEGKQEALEFANGNYGLFESALEYSRDRTPPKVRMTSTPRSAGGLDVTFQFVNEPSVIRYTTDGSKPTSSSPAWDSTGPREPGEVFHLTSTTKFRWRATDIKGNVSSGSQRFRIR